MAKNKAKVKKLTAKQERFVSEYLIDPNATRAYRRAFGCSATSAQKHASRLVGNGGVRAAIVSGQRALRKAANVSATRVISEVIKIAFSDIGNVFDLTSKEWVLREPAEIPPEDRGAIRGFRRVTRRTCRGTVETFEVKFWDKLRALDMLMRHLGLYQPLPPLEQLLAALEPKLRAVVKAAIAAHVEGRTRTDD